MIKSLIYGIAKYDIVKPLALKKLFNADFKILYTIFKQFKKVSLGKLPEMHP